MGRIEGGFGARLRSNSEWKIRLVGKEIGSTAVDGEGGGAKQVLIGPAAGQVEADAAGGAAHAGADFEELSAQSFDLGGAPGLR